MSLAPNALTTLAKLASATTLAAASSRLEDLIGVASTAIEDELSRFLGFRKFTTDAPELYAGNGRQFLFLRRYPIRSVEAVQTCGYSVTDALVDPEMPHQCALWRFRGWPKSGRMYSYPDLTGDRDLSQVNYNVTLAYSGGYILPQYDSVVDAVHNPDGLPCDLPLVIQEACILSVVDFVRRPQTQLKVEKTPGGWWKEWGLSGLGVALPDRALALLAPYYNRSMP